MSNGASSCSCGGMTFVEKAILRGVPGRYTKRLRIRFNTSQCLVASAAPGQFELRKVKVHTGAFSYSPLQSEFRWIMYCWRTIQWELPVGQRQCFKLMKKSARFVCHPILNAFTWKAWTFSQRAVFLREQIILQCAQCRIRGLHYRLLYTLQNACPDATALGALCKTQNA